VKQPCRNVKSVSNGKRAIIIALYATASLILALGTGYVVYSTMNNINFKVLSTTLPGAVFGLMVAYLGARYFLMVGKLKEKLYKDSAVFSWKNFRRAKAARSR